MTRIVIVGGGFAGAQCARQLEQKDRDGEVEVFLVSDTNYMLFTPLLIEAGTGSLEPRHTVVPLRDFLGRSTFIAGRVKSIDVEGRAIDYEISGGGWNATLEYDHLVLAPGSVTKLPPVPGLKEHALSMKSVGDAVALRDRMIQLLEQANATEDEGLRRGLLHFLVVGGSFTGVEVAGEFHAFVQEATRHYPNLRPEDCRFTLVELSPRILPALDENLADFARKHLEERGLRIRLETSAEEIFADHVILSDGQRLDTHTVIWTAGIAQNPLLTESGLPTDDGGWLLTERDGRVKGHEKVWALGDCARNEDPDGQPYPPTAQHALRGAKQVAENLLRIARGETTRPLDISSQGTLAALGCRTAVAKVFGIRLSGFPAWFLWRTVYLFKMPGWSRRIRVALDWTLSLFFRRPVVQLGAHRRSG